MPIDIMVSNILALLRRAISHFFSASGGSEKKKKKKRTVTQVIGVAWLRRTASQQEGRRKYK